MQTPLNNKVTAKQEIARGIFLRVCSVVMTFNTYPYINTSLRPLVPVKIYLELFYDIPKEIPCRGQRCRPDEDIAAAPFKSVPPAGGGMASVARLRIVVVGVAEIAIAVQICGNTVYPGVRECCRGLVAVVA
jgi:hypothetical protein